VNVQPVTLEGTSVRLVPSSEDHAEELAQIATPETFQFFVTGAPRSYDAEGMAHYVRVRNADPTVLPFTVVDKSSGRAVGMSTYLDIRPAHRGLEIGMTWYAEHYRGTRVNPEAKLLLLEHAFTELGCVRVQLKTDERNVQSQNAILKLGARFEGILRNHMIFENGFIRNTYMYSILPNEWPSVRAGLEARLRN
jgi:RimJ/RimL family protein N-acetyltransferase